MKMINNFLFWSKFIFIIDFFGFSQFSWLNSTQTITLNFLFSNSQNKPSKAQKTCYWAKMSCQKFSTKFINLSHCLLSMTHIEIPQRHLQKKLWSWNINENNLLSVPSSVLFYMLAIPELHKSITIISSNLKLFSSFCSLSFFIFSLRFHFWLPWL